MNFSKTLIHWYLQNKRKLPWRKTKNPYYIWLSEIILQQTRVNQGLQYYENFVDAFPTINDLASANQETVLKLWQGLGYYSRARNLHFSAKYIVNELNGDFPKTYIDLLQLKGVGDYTASAIASICYNSPTAVVDGNVYRVLSRYFGIKTIINSSKGVKEFKELAQQLIDKNQPGTFNQAIMEFGAIQCKPKNPNCIICPLSNSCIALQKQLITTLPIKEQKITIKKRFFNYLVIIDQYENLILQQRKKKDIWQNLYEFPLIETPKEIYINDLLHSNEFSKITMNISTSASLFNKLILVHKLTHQHIYTKFWIITSSQKIKEGILWSDFEKYPVPILIHNFVENFKRQSKSKA